MPCFSPLEYPSPLFAVSGSSKVGHRAFRRTAVSIWPCRPHILARNLAPDLWHFSGHFCTTHSLHSPSIFGVRFMLWPAVHSYIMHMDWSSSGIRPESWVVLEGSRYVVRVFARVCQWCSMQSFLVYGLRLQPYLTHLRLVIFPLPGGHPLHPRHAGWCQRRRRGNGRGYILPQRIRPLHFHPSHPDTWITQATHPGNTS